MVRKLCCRSSVSPTTSMGYYWRQGPPTCSGMGRWMCVLGDFARRLCLPAGGKGVGVPWGSRGRRESLPRRGERWGAARTRRWREGGLNLVLAVCSISISILVSSFKVIVHNTESTITRSRNSSDRPFIRRLVFSSYMLPTLCVSSYSRSYYLSDENASVVFSSDT